MRLLFVVGVCLTLVFVVECLEGKAEFIEDEEEMDQRHLIKRCKSDADCGSGHCCAVAKCKRIWRTSGEGQPCSFKSRYCSFGRCGKDLECRRTSSILFGRYKCFKAAPPPTEEPGSGDYDL
ncbi:uncharacterized protein [Porites lutea]|uniref:uncharacterized protein n=1 Tax=Porites lutea TaxID=51062 RepID=UPI003CC598A1